MANNSNIEWTDSTWQVTSGCTKVSDGCKFCYAETMANRLAGMAKKDIAEGRDPKGKRSYLNVMNDRGNWNNSIELLPNNLTIPLKRKKPTVYFVNSMSDLFHEDVPFDYVDKVFAVMALCPRHTFQVLTKRPERMAEYINSPRPKSVSDWYEDRPCDWWVREAAVSLILHNPKSTPNGAETFGGLASWRPVWPPPNVWLGCSPVNQKTYDEYKSFILKTPAAVRFLSLEPLLGPIALGDLNGINWVIVGGESGPGARPCQVEWIRSIIGQCKAAGVPCFVKQLGAKPIGDGKCKIDCPCGLHHGFRDPKGGDMAEWPEDLRVRQMPEVPHAI